MTVSSPARVAEYPPGSSYGPRRLVDHEFVWVLKGSARWRVERREGDVTEVLLRPGMVALARAGDLDRYDWDPEQTSSHAYVHFHTTSGPDLTSVPPVRRLDTSHEPLGALCAHLLRLRSQSEATALLRTSHVVSLLLDLFVDGPLPRPPQPVSPRLVPALDLVRRTWRAQGMCLMRNKDLADACGVSPAHFSRTFAREVGTSPAAALELVRLAHAATTLTRSNLTIDQVARLTGFADAYHFSRRFSGAYGQPPGRYRTMAGQDPYDPLARAGLLDLWQDIVRSEQ